MPEDLINIKPKGFDLQSVTIPKVFKMKSLINWKTTLIGLAILIVKFIGTTLGLSPDLIASIVTILTALIGLIAADGSNVQKK